MKRTFYSLAMLAALLISASARPVTGASTEIKLRERVAPHGTLIRLGDVAEIAAVDQGRAQSLARLPLMPSPAAGTERFLRPREIQDMLVAQGVDAEGLRFTGAAQVALAPSTETEISQNSLRSNGKPSRPLNRHALILAGYTEERPSTRLDDVRANELRQRLTSIIANYLNAKTGEIVNRRIECDVTPRDLAQLNGATSTPVCQGGSEPWTGRQRFTLTFSTSEGNVQLPVSAEVTPPAMPAVFAVRPIARGGVITAADIELRTTDSTPKNSGQKTVARSVDELIGKEARQAIQAGDLVFSDQVQSPVLIKRGELVTVTSQSGGIRVRTTARALHDGAHGELVQVESLGSKEKFDARVTGLREAAVFAMSRPAVPEQSRQNRLDTARRSVFTTTTRRARRLDGS